MATDTPPASDEPAERLEKDPRPRGEAVHRGPVVGEGSLAQEDVPSEERRRTRLPGTEPGGVRPREVQ